MRLIWRLAMICFALVPVGLLVVASRLTPDADGLGTHQQLGLPPCSMRLIFGIRCPACGMTTSWSHFSNGDWIGSLQSNIAGFLLAGLALVAAPICVRSAATGRMLSSRGQFYLAVSLVAIVIVATIEWLARLWFF